MDEATSGSRVGCAASADDSPVGQRAASADAYLGHCDDGASDDEERNCSSDTQECDAEEPDGDVQELESKKPSSMNAFKRRTMARIVAHAKALRSSKRKERKRAQSESNRYSHVDTDKFMRETQARVTERLVVLPRLKLGTKPARVAIVGAGPVGLWVAVLLAREHARLTTTAGRPRITRLPKAPTIDLFERRTAGDGYGTRRIILAISTMTQDLLNRNLLSAHELTSQHSFSPTCSINFIEATLRENFERYANAGFGALHFGSHVVDPDALLTDSIHGGAYDVVVIAGGRQALKEDWRVQRGLGLHIGNSEDALILKFESASGKYASMDSKAEAALARAAGRLRIFLRPGASPQSGYVWIVGLPLDATQLARTEISTGACNGGCSSFISAWTSLGIDSELAPCALEEVQVTAADGRVFVTCLAMKLLDDALQPSVVSPRITEAAFWHSAEVTHKAPGGGWLVLAGDVACGKPFYTGSNLNGHFGDVVPLVKGGGSGWSQWDQEAQAPFRKYVERYRIRTAAVGYRRAAGHASRRDP